MSPSPLRDQLHKDGFVIIRQILTSPQLTTLRESAAQTTLLARQGAWPYIRTVGKQFPPWPNKPDPNGGGIWGVQGLMNPSLPQHKIFTENYFSDAVLDIAKELMDCQDDDLVMELFNMLVRPEQDFELRWHRDDIAAHATAEQEMERLREPEWHTQWNLALWEDESLVVVPGSHNRARTEAERGADPFESMTSQLVVRLQAGDAVFYNNNILHRGVYDSRKERMSLHGSVGHVGGSELRARNVLQHGMRWVEECEFGFLGFEGGRIRGRAEGMRERLVRLGRQSSEVDYSLQG